MKFLQMFSFIIGFMTLKFIADTANQSTANNNFNNTSSQGLSINIGAGVSGDNAPRSATDQSIRTSQKADQSGALSLGVAVGSGASASGGAVSKGGMGSDFAEPIPVLSNVGKFLTPINIVIAGAIGYFLYTKNKKAK